MEASFAAGMDLAIVLHIESQLHFASNHLVSLVEWASSHMPGKDMLIPLDLQVFLGGRRKSKHALLSILLLPLST